MLTKLMKVIPQHWLVYMYRRLPFTRLKNWIVYRAQHKFLVAVLGVITNDKGQILLLKHSYREEPWGIPGGWMELEQPEVGLAREVKEETGLVVEITGLAKAIYGTKPNRVDLIFRGRVIDGEFKASSEITDIRFCNLNEWPEGMPASQKSIVYEVLTGTRD